MNVPCLTCGTQLDLLADMCWFCGRMYVDSQALFDEYVSRNPFWMEAEDPALD